MPDIPRIRFLRRFRLSPTLEQEFQAYYYATYRTPLRYACAFAAFLYLILLNRDVHQGRTGAAMTVDGVPCAAFLIIFALTYLRGFRRVWQPGYVLMIGTILPLVMADHAQTIASAATLPTLTAKMDDFLAASFFTLMLLVGIVRVQFVWAVLVQVLFFALCVRDGLLILHAPAATVWGIAQFVLAIQIILTFNGAVQERLQREAFLANHALARERADEQRRRERTEAMLHVLGQAIGGIVHDLGNPLTAVRTGVETLKATTKEEPADPALTGELLEIVGDGAQMLDYLRLSLLEQTRVLEGKDTPVERERVAFRRVVEAGAHYQSPKFTQERRIVIEGEEVTAWIDGRRLTTLLMNLIGNALKYSDGEIHIAWRCEAGNLLCAVRDQGRRGRGITQAQAARLFVPFGRLDVHAGQEGTGLGLVSARMVAEAHGGEVFIEGFADGTPASPQFSTARAAYPSMLAPDFRTAFVVACPLALDPSDPKESAPGSAALSH